MEIACWHRYTSEPTVNQHATHPNPSVPLHLSPIPEGEDFTGITDSNVGGLPASSLDKLQKPNHSVSRK
jgi:hypothetical protein